MGPRVRLWLSHELSQAFLRAESTFGALELEPRRHLCGAKLCPADGVDCTFRLRRALRARLEQFEGAAEPLELALAEPYEFHIRQVARFSPDVRRDEDLIPLRLVRGPGGEFQVRAALISVPVE